MATRGFLYSGGGTVFLTPSSVSCAGSTPAGAPGEDRHDPVDPERDATVRRRAVLERVEQEAEAPLRLLRADAERVEDLLLDLGGVDTDRAAADLDAVEHYVVAA